MNGRLKHVWQNQCGWTHVFQHVTQRFEIAHNIAHSMLVIPQSGGSINLMCQANSVWQPHAARCSRAACRTQPDVADS
jgi:hypothetical protein